MKNTKSYVWPRVKYSNLVNYGKTTRYNCENFAIETQSIVSIARFTVGLQRVISVREYGRGTAVGQGYRCGTSAHPLEQSTVLSIFEQIKSFFSKFLHNCFIDCCRVLISVNLGPYRLPTCLVMCSGSGENESVFIVDSILAQTSSSFKLFGLSCTRATPEDLTECADNWNQNF